MTIIIEKLKEFLNRNHKERNPFEAQNITDIHIYEHSYVHTLTVKCYKDISALGDCSCFSVFLYCYLEI